MLTQEQTSFLQQIQQSFQNNLGNRLSPELCNFFLGRIENYFRSQPTSMDQVQEVGKEKGQPTV